MDSPCLTDREPAHFDPWSATAEQASQLANLDRSAQYQAAQEVLQLREACQRDDGGCRVLQCMTLCGEQLLTPPKWLWTAFIRCQQRVARAEVGSWDEAFGRPYPRHARLATVRRARELQHKVHTAAWRLAVEEPELPINRDFFERIGETPGICRSGATVERIYYHALGAGMVNVSQLRRAAGNSSIVGAKVED